VYTTLPLRVSQGMAPEQLDPRTSYVAARIRNMQTLCKPTSSGDVTYAYTLCVSQFALRCKDVFLYNYTICCEFYVLKWLANTTHLLPLHVRKLAPQGLAMAQSGSVLEISISLQPWEARSLTLGLKLSSCYTVRHTASSIWHRSCMLYALFCASVRHAHICM
jgi:hypothetical protein